MQLQSSTCKNMNGITFQLCQALNSLKSWKAHIKFTFMIKLLLVESYLLIC